MNGLTSKVLAMAALMSSCSALEKSTADEYLTLSNTEMSLLKQGYNSGVSGSSLQQTGYLTKEVDGVAYCAHQVGSTPYVIVETGRTPASARMHAMTTAKIVGQSFTEAQMQAGDTSKDYVLSRAELEEMR